MKGTNHLLIGITTGVFLIDKIDINSFATIGLCTLGSVLVDIDAKTSLINKTLFPVGNKHRNKLKAIVGAGLLFAPVALAKYVGIIILLSILACKAEYRFSLFSGFTRIEYHRTIFHDPIIGSIIFILPLLALSIPGEYIVPLLIGLTTHYVTDSFNIYGLPLYLLGGKKLRMPIYFRSENKIAEYCILAAYIVCWSSFMLYLT